MRGRKLRLIAEMELPGTASLEFEVTPQGTGSEIDRTASFAPSELCGRPYRDAVAPFHGILSPETLERIAAAVPSEAPASEHPIAGQLCG